MFTVVAATFLSCLASGERANPKLKSELPWEGSVMLQRNSRVRAQAPFALEEDLEHLPLCDPSIVEESCRLLNGIENGASPASVTWAVLDDMLSASSLEAARQAMGLPLDASVGCMELCTAAVQYVNSTGGVLPPFSNVACRTVHGNTTCDVEADPGVLARKFGSTASLELPDHGPVLAVKDETGAGSESEERASLHQEAVVHTPRGALSALLQREMGAAGNATSGGEVLTYSVWEAVERIANLFCVYPSSGEEADVFVSSEPVLLQVGTASADATVAYRARQAQAWLATVLRNVNGNREADAQRTWFGGAGSMNAEQVRQRILRTFNFISREFTQGFYFVVPADTVRSSQCGNGVVAYVWKSGTNSYQETTSPRCSSRDNPRTRNCAVDQNGKYYVYLCNAFLSAGEDYQAGVLIHEASHHHGAIDFTYDLNVARTTSQDNQLKNARNYQYFAYTVAGACLDDDPNCGGYAAQGYCSSDRIQGLCKRSCGICRTGGGGCADQDPNCAVHYAQYCNTDRIRGLCQRTCGACR